jgi:hypothetical protein
VALSPSRRKPKAWVIFTAATKQNAQLARATTARSLAS